MGASVSWASSGRIDFSFVFEIAVVFAYSVLRLLVTFVEFLAVFQFLAKLYLVPARCVCLNPV